MKEDKYQCPLCNVSHSLTKEYPNNNTCNDNKLFCSSCINKILNKENNLIFPNDFIKNIDINSTTKESKNENNKNKDNNNKEINNSNIKELKQYSVNKNLIQELKKQTSNKSIFKEGKSQQILIDNNLKAKKDTNSSIKKYYIRKQVKVNKLPEFQNREYYTLCNIHSLPLNVICINEKQKICSQCALNNKHLNHKIITEKDFYEYVEELSKIYKNMEINKNKYKDFKNSNFSVINEITQNFIEIQNNLIELKNKIINNLNEQFNNTLNYINLRKNEILDKYKYSNYDISNLIESSSNWINLVSEKLDESNLKTDSFKNINFSKFLSDDKNKNIFNLINSGKDLNERFNLIQEVNSVIDKLEEYKQIGITIKQNKDIIKSILDSNNKLVYVEENQELIKNLNLSPYESLLKKNSQIKNDKNNIIINEKVESDDNNIYYVKNINNNEKKEIKNKEEDKKIYFRKVISEISKVNMTESDFYKEKNNIKISRNLSKNKNYTGLNFHTNRNAASIGKSIKKKLVLSEPNETFPLLNNINRNISKLLRNKTTSNINLKIPKNIKNETKVNNDSLEINKDKNININFNGHIFNYNSDSEFSVNMPEIKNSDENETSNKKINEIIKLLTPKKNENKKNEKHKIIRCFSFHDNTDKNKLNNIVKKNSSTSISIKNTVNNSKNNNIINNCNNYKTNGRKNLKNYELLSLKTENNGIKTKKIKYNYQTFTNKEMEKYVNYQLKKSKPNFNRVNLRDNGMKLICSFFSKNKNRKYKEIKLQGCNLNDIDFDLFTRSLIENNINIPMINVSENELTDDCCFLVLDFINDYNDIQNILLTNNYFSKGIKEKIKELLKMKKKQLDEINILI